MSEFLYPGDAGYIPKLFEPEYVQKIGRSVTKVVHGPTMVIALRYDAGKFDPLLTEEERNILNNIDSSALESLGLPMTTTSKIALTYQGLRRNFGWHADGSNDVKILVNAGKKATRALIAPKVVYSEMQHGYPPDETAVIPIDLEPGSAYVLDNRTHGHLQMLHATSQQEDRTMLRIDAAPAHRDPLELPRGAIVYPGLRCNS